MNDSNPALNLYLKSIACFTAIFLSLIYVFYPIYESVSHISVKYSDEVLDGFEFSSTLEKSYINVLMVGLDKDETRTDVIMVAQFNLTDKSINFLQIPRDTYVDNNRYDKKINSAYGAGGIERTIEEIQSVVDIEIDRYVVITTSGFRNVIDEVGGIWYDIPQDMNYDDDYQDLHIHLKAGYQLLDGDKAEQYVRCRNIYPDGDLGRIEAQSGFIKESISQIVEKCNTGKADTTNLITAVADMVVTNFGTVEMFKYAPHLLKVNIDKVNTLMLEGVAGDKDRISYFFADYEANEQLIKEYFTPDISEADFSEVELRDDTIGSNSIESKIDEQLLGSESIPQGTKVYVLDYSGTEGAYMNETLTQLEEMGCEIVGSNVAQTITAEKTYCIANSDNIACPLIAKALGLKNYYINPDNSINADVVVILGKED
ncbi:MAG: LCP family protein [Clostridia bacterium]|nr:LCP family protein [Clostridia bacterium]